MSVLTLARFILEHSLMDYETIRFSDSKMAAASLFIANRMVDNQGWNKTLAYYSGIYGFRNVIMCNIKIKYLNL